MKITVIASPALCRLPLMEVSTLTQRVIKPKQRPAGFLARISARVWEAITSRVPVGYEDEAGFHHGVATVSIPVDGAGLAWKWSPGKSGLRARWKAMRAHNFDSGGRLVLQWDSSSLPPCQPSPESFLIRSRPRHWVEPGQYPASYTGGRRNSRSRILVYCAGRRPRSSAITSTGGKRTKATPSGNGST